MKKRISLLLCCCITLSVFFCACESEQVKQAKTAYKDGKYEEVVELLSKEENLNDSAKDMLAVSEANIAYQNKDYLGAVQKLVTSSKGVKEEQYEEMFKAALDDAISTGSSENVVTLLEIDGSKEEAVYETVKTACTERNYNAFLTLDGLIAGLEDGDLKTKLSDFGKEYENLRAEAFLVGEWEWTPEGDEKPAKVSVVTYEDNLIGRLTDFGPFFSDYHYKVDDVYWKDFKFDSSDTFICYNLTRMNDAEGSAYPETASGKIDYENKTITLTLTEAKDSVRTWTRID